MLPLAHCQSLQPLYLSCLFSLFQAVPGNAYQNLQKAVAMWQKLCNSDPKQNSASTVLREVKIPLSDSSQAEQEDVVVLGGMLGIFLATALLVKGRKVTVIEQNALLGRDQEWNISRADMQVGARSCHTHESDL